MSHTFTIKPNCEYDLLTAIESTLKGQPGDTNQLYFSGEFDSNQTKFEQLSNNLEIGVISSNKTVALVLLRFLRIIIDNNTPLLMYDVCQQWKEIRGKEVEFIVKNGDKVKISKTIRILAEKEKHYMSKFSLDEEISCKLYGNGGSHIVTKYLDEVDIWTLPRVMTEIKKLFQT